MILALLLSSGFLVLIHCSSGSWNLVQNLNPGEKEDGRNIQSAIRLSGGRRLEICTDMSSNILHLRKSYVKGPPPDREDFCRVNSVQDITGKTVYNLMCRRRKLLLQDKFWFQKTLQEYIRTSNIAGNFLRVLNCMERNLHLVNIPTMPQRGTSKKPETARVRPTTTTLAALLTTPAITTTTTKRTTTPTTTTTAAAATTTKTTTTTTTSATITPSGTATTSSFNAIASTPSEDMEIHMSTAETVAQLTSTSGINEDETSSDIVEEETSTESAAADGQNIQKSLDKSDGESRREPKIANLAVVAGPLLAVQLILLILLVFTVKRLRAARNDTIKENPTPPPTQAIPGKITKPSAAKSPMEVTADLWNAAKPEKKKDSSMRQSQNAHSEKQKSRKKERSQKSQKQKK